jgi:hypothetical protein
MDFSVGNTEIGFHSYHPLDSDPIEINVDVTSKEKDITRIIKYTFSQSWKKGRK